MLVCCVTALPYYMPCILPVTAISIKFSNTRLNFAILHVQMMPGSQTFRRPPIARSTRPLYGKNVGMPGKRNYELLTIACAQ